MEHSRHEYRRDHRLRHRTGRGFWPVVRRPATDHPRSAGATPSSTTPPRRQVPTTTQPFATIVTKDYPPGDERSRLNRPDTFRLNVFAGEGRVHRADGCETAGCRHARYRPECARPDRRASGLRHARVAVRRESGARNRRRRPGVAGAGSHVGAHAVSTAALTGLPRGSSRRSGHGSRSGPVEPVGQRGASSRVRNRSSTWSSASRVGCPGSSMRCSVSTE